MNFAKYTDSEGNHVLSYSTNISGLAIVPIGQSKQEAIAIDSKEFKKLQAKSNKTKTIEQQLAEMQKRLKILENK